MIIIAGPCVIENKDVLKETVEDLLESIPSSNNFIFKSSFQKDNRTSIRNFMGLDKKEAIGLLKEIKEEYNVPICTDIHCVEDIDLLKEIIPDIDVIQIPAYLAKQLTLLKQASVFTAENGKILHIKKPQFIPAEDMRSIIENAKYFGATNIIATDRGTMYGPNRFFMDPRHVSIMKKNNDVKVVVDTTHPNKNYPGTQLENAIVLAKSYLSAGADGIFMETHPSCNTALCDKETMVSSKSLKDFFRSIV
jgi:2-dehydro-3-deoxyphosphooctonate aldolase (KDO 8-P synthase)